MADQQDGRDPQRMRTTRLDALIKPAMDVFERVSGRHPEQPSPGTLPGLSTSFVDLDTLTGGLHPGELWVVTGLSGSGKSVFGLDLARGAAVRESAPTAIVQSRDPAADVATRVLSAESRVPLHHLRNIGLTDGDWARLARVMIECAQAPLFVTTVEFGQLAPPTADGLLDASAAVVAQERLKLLIVDDLPNNTTPEQLRRLKALAVKTGACAVALITDDSSRLMAAVEQDAAVVADIVLRVDREHDMPPGSNSPRIGEADFLVLRHRRGPIAAITVAFQGHYGRFVDITNN